MKEITISDLGIPLNHSDLESSLDNMDPVIFGEARERISAERAELHDAYYAVLMLMESGELDSSTIGSLPVDDARLLAHDLEAIHSVRDDFASLSKRGRRILKKLLGI